MTAWSASFRSRREVVGMETARILSCLGLCVKAGKVIFGVPMICDAMRKGGAKAPVLVLEAADTSENTHKKISDKCAYYEVEHIRLTAEGASLAAAVGKSGSIGAVALTDPGMSEMLRRYL